MINSEFYNAFAGQYDSMIDFEKALPRRKTLISGLIEDQFKTAADLGCGSGIDSISLANLGLKVVAYDPSEEMLNLARMKAIESGTNNIKFSGYSIHKIPEEYFEKFDFITSLGNTLSNISNEEITPSVKNIFNLAKSGARIVVQVVNYERLIQQEERILNITNTEDLTFVRFYDYFDEFVNFNILSFNTKNPLQRTLITTKVYNHKALFLKSLFQLAGFQRVEVYGDLNKSPFNEISSKDIVVIAEK